MLCETPISFRISIGRVLGHYEVVRKVGRSNAIKLLDLDLVP